MKRDSVDAPFLHREGKGIGTQMCTSVQMVYIDILKTSTNNQ